MDIRTAKTIEKEYSKDEITEEEIAESVINSLKEAEKFLRGEIELPSIHDDLNRWLKIAEEMEKNEC